MSQQDMLKLKGVVNARLRHLVSDAPNSHFYARAWPKAVKMEGEKGKVGQVFLIGLKQISSRSNSFDLKDWKTKVDG